MSNKNNKGSLRQNGDSHVLSHPPQVGGKSENTIKKGKYTKTYILTTIVPGAIIFIGIMLIAIGEPSAEYVLAAGVAVQAATLSWQIWQVKLSKRR